MWAGANRESLGSCLHYLWERPVQQEARHWLKQTRSTISQSHSSLSGWEPCFYSQQLGELWTPFGQGMQHSSPKDPYGGDDIYFNKLGLGDCHIGLMKSQRGGRRKASLSPWRVQGMLDTFSSLSWNISLLFSLSLCLASPSQSNNLTMLGRNSLAVKEGVADTWTTGCGSWG